jgi:hypothetical protein
MNNIITFQGKKYRLVTNEDQALNNKDIVYCGICDNYHFVDTYSRRTPHKRDYYSAVYSPVKEEYTEKDYE